MTFADDRAILDRILASRTSEPEVTHPREIAEITAKHVAEILAQGERDADVAEAKFGTADEIKSHEGVVTKLPEVHDPEGDDLPYHVPAGRATQVLGSREIDPSRVPDQLNPLVTDSNGRALAPRSALAREREAIKVMREHEALKKLMRKWGVKRFSYSFSR